MYIYIYIIQEAEAEVKPEIVTTLKELYFHQEISKTEAQDGKPRIIVKNMIKRKEKFFQKVEKFQTILITTNGKTRRARTLYTLFLRYNLVKTTKVKMCK